MKTTVLAIATLFASLSITTLSAQGVAEKLKPGDDLPAMTNGLKNANGGKVTLKTAARENGLLVMFSCNTCPYVVKNQPITQKTIAYAAAHKVGMIIINSNEAKRGGDDSYEAMQQYAKDQHYTVPYVVDDNSVLADAFGANHTPEIFLFNKQGKLVYKGAMNDNPSDPGGYKKMYIEDAINAMVDGKLPDPSTTKSIGCSIKRKA